MTDPYTTYINLGIASFIAVYLVRWITIKLNRKFDKLSWKIEELNKSINELKNEIKLLREKLG